MDDGSKQFAERLANGYLRIVEQTDSGTVVEILSGGPRAHVFRNFVFVCCVIAAGATLLFGIGTVREEFPPVVLVGPALLWCLVAALAVMWWRVRSSRFVLSLTSDRLTLDRHVFNRTTSQAVRFAGGTVATLHDTPFRANEPGRGNSRVYGVEIRGDGQAVRFGMALSHSEKEWLVRLINNHISQAEPIGGGVVARCPVCGKGVRLQSVPAVSEAVFCSSCGQRIPAGRVEKVGREPAVPVRPSDVPDWVPVQVLDASHNRLAFEVRQRGSLLAQVLVSCVLFVLFVAMAGASAAMTSWIVRTENWEGLDALVLLNGVACGVLSLVPLILLLFQFFGGTVVEVLPDEIRRSYRLGPLRYTSRIVRDQVEDVVVSPDRYGNDPQIHTGGKFCVVRGEGTWGATALTVGTDVETARTVAGLVQYQLDRTGTVSAS